MINMIKQYIEYNVNEKPYVVLTPLTSYLRPWGRTDKIRSIEPVFPNYRNWGSELYNNQTFIPSTDNRNNEAYNTYRQSISAKLRESVYNDWAVHWRHMELRYAVNTDVGECAWCQNEATPIQKGEIIIREQVTKPEFYSLHPQCALDKLNKLKHEITLGITKLESMIDISYGMRKGDKKVV